MTVRNLALNEDGDIYLTDANLTMIGDGESVRQAVRSNLLFFQGEWFLNLDLGIPYFQEVYVKSPNFVALRAIFRAAIINTPGVGEVVKLELVYDRSARTLTVNWSCTANLGEIVSDTVELS